jgi:hypothetical protein
MVPAVRIITDDAWKKVPLIINADAGRVWARFIRYVGAWSTSTAIVRYLVY